MPDIEENIATWNAQSSWSAHGEEWSGPWGSSEAEWWSTLLPRLHAFLPAKTILELGPGHGRWTAYLKDLCEELILADLAEACIESCRARFHEATNIAYHVNDGRSLPAVPERSVDLVFSFDSLVHAEADALEGYAREFARVLKADGVAFIHHSNMAALRRPAQIARLLPDRVRRPLTIRGAVVNLYAWRAESVSARWFAEVCHSQGLACVGQELIAWEYGRFRTDAITLVTPRGSVWDRPMVTVDNRDFMDEARVAAQTGELYSGRRFGGSPPRP